MPKTRKRNGRYARPDQVLKEKLTPLAVVMGSAFFSYGVSLSPDIYQFFNPGEAQVQAQLITTPTPEPTPTPEVVPSEEPEVIVPEGKVVVKEDETVTAPTPAVRDTTEKEQIIAYIVEVFGVDAPDAFNVVYCENRQLDPYATNHNRNGSIDRGIFQLNSQYWGGEELYDWKLNIDTAYKVFERAGKKWTPWTCSHRVGQKNYLGE